MKITEKELIQIINEEIKDMIENDDIDEGVLDQLKAKASGALSSAGSKLAGAVGADSASADMAANAKLKQASSIMSSYAQHMLKLKQKLEKDVTKLGLGDIDDIKKVSQSIDQSRALTQKTADLAPRSEKFRQAVQAAAGQQPAAAPAAAEPAAAPAATEPAAAPAAAEPATPQAASPAAADQEKRDAKNARRRELRAQKKAAAKAEQEKKNARNTRRRAARANRAASTVPSGAANAGPANESKVKKGETLNEQLQKISERWRFGK